MIAKVYSAERVGTSSMGNPTYELTLEDFEGNLHYRVRTMTNAGLAYGITNREYADSWHRYEFTRAGRVRSARPVTLFATEAHNATPEYLEGREVDARLGNEVIWTPAE